jgi:general secretion pathway protein K
MVRKKDGIVLMLVLFLIAILSAVVIESLKSVSVDNACAEIKRGYVESYHNIKSALNFEKALILYDAKENSYDTMFDIWNNKDKIKTLNGYDDKYFSSLDVNIEDECGKIPINFIADKKNGEIYRDVLFRLLTNEPFKLKKETVNEIVLSLWYWIDKKSVEDKYAKNLPVGINNIVDVGQFFKTKPKDAPISNLGELFLMKTIDPKLMYGTKKRPGLFSFLTVYCASGRININTAPKEVIRAMVPDSVPKDTALEFADALIKYRSDEFHKDLLSKSDWYRNKMPGYDDIILPSNIIETKSDFFRIDIKSKKGIFGMNEVEIIERKKEKNAYKIKAVYKEVY